MLGSAWGPFQPETAMSSFNQATLTSHVPVIETVGVATIPNFLKAGVRDALLNELEQYQLNPEPEEYGQYRVKQAFRSVTAFPDGSLFLEVRDELEAWLNTEFSREFPQHLSEPLQFSVPVAQRYEVGPIGVSAHRDGKSFINLIAIFVLEGTGRFCVCDNRQGSNPQLVRNEPGDLLLMRGPGFLGSDFQPFHFVDTISVRRTSFSLRHKRLSIIM